MEPYTHLNAANYTPTPSSCTDCRTVFFFFEKDSTLLCIERKKNFGTALKTERKMLGYQLSKESPETRERRYQAKQNSEEKLRH